MLSGIFPPAKQFTHAELVEIATVVNTKSFRDYLIQQAKQYYEAIGEGLPGAGESAEEYLRRHATVVGSLAVVSQLLAIEKPITTSPN